MELNLACLLPPDASPAARAAMPTLQLCLPFPGDGLSEEEARADLPPMSALPRMQMYACCGGLVALTAGGALPEQQRLELECKLHSARRALLTLIAAHNGRLPLAVQGGEVAVPVRLNMQHSAAQAVHRPGGKSPPWITVMVSSV